MKNTPIKLPAKLAAAFAAVHLILVVSFSVLMLFAAREGSAQWQFGWLIFMLVDWPVSQVIMWDGWPTTPLPLPHPFDAPRSFAVPLFVFGVIGTLWYGIVGLTVGCVIEGFSRAVGRLSFSNK